MPVKFWQMILRSWFFLNYLITIHIHICNLSVILAIDLLIRSEFLKVPDWTHRTEPKFWKVAFDFLYFCKILLVRILEGSGSKKHTTESKSGYTCNWNLTRYHLKTFAFLVRTLEEFWCVCFFYQPIKG